MRSRQVIQGLLLMGGIAIVALLILPAVHVPFIVVHGPVSALRAQRAALLFQILIQMAALAFAGRYVGLLLFRATENDAKLSLSQSSVKRGFVLRC